MLKIEKNQIQFLQRKKLQEFIKKVEQFLLDNHPGHARGLASRGDLDGWIKRVVNRAIEKGFVTEQQICRIVNVAVFNGEDYEKADWAQKIMKEDLSANTMTIQLQQGSINQIKELRGKVQTLLKDVKERRIQTFCEENQERLQTLGKYRYGIKLPDEAAELIWLKTVATTATRHGYKLQAELSLWMEIAMAKGLYFHEKKWAKNILDSNLEPDKKLLKLHELKNNKVNMEIGGQYSGK